MTRTPWIDGLLVLALSTAYLSLLPECFSVFDEGLLADTADRLQRGEMLYRDVWSYWNPGGFWLGAALFELAGTSVHTLRVSLGLFGAAAAVGVWRLARDHAERVPAALAGLAAPLVCYPVWWIASSHWYSTFTAIAAGVALRGCFRDPPSARATLLAGALCGVTYAMLQPVGAFLSAAVGLVLVWDRLWTASPVAALRTGLVLALGILTPTLAMYGYFALHGLLGPMLYDTLLWNLRHFGPNWKVAYGASPWPTSVPVSWLVRPFLMVAPPLACTLAALLAARRYVQRRPTAEDRRLFSLAGLGLGLLASNYYYPDIVHLAFAAPPACAVLPALGSRLALRRGGRLLAGAAAGLLLLFVGLVGAGALRQHRSQCSSVLATARGDIATSESVLEHMSAVLDFFARRLDPGDEFYVYPYGPGYNFLAGRPSPTPYGSIFPGNPAISTREQLGEVVQALERRRVRYVLVGFLFEPDGLEKLDTPLERYIRRRYRPVASLPMARVWERVPR